MKRCIRKICSAAAAMVMAFSVITAPLSRAALLSAETITPPYSCPAVYDALIAMKADYPSGMPWTNDDFYAWNGGGMYYGGYGCVAFAYLMSDAAFGYLPSHDSYTFEPASLRTGDLIRYFGHSVVILEVCEDYFVIAEGNINESIYWGRTLSFDEIEGGFEYSTTRYPDEFAFREDSLALNAGETVEAAVISRDAVELTWTSADPSVAAVDENGCITGVGNGTTTITAASAVHSETLEVTVTGVSYPAGDINLDGAVAIADAILLNRYIAEDSSLPVNPHIAAALDCNKDAVADANDTVWLLSLLSNL